MVNKDPVNGVMVNELFKLFLVLGVKGSGDVFVVVLRRFLPDVKSAIKNGLREAVPEETGTTITPRVVVPAPESVLREVGDAGSVVLLLEEIEEVSIFLRGRLAYRRRNEMAGEGGRGVDEEKKGKGEGGGDIGETIVEKGEEIKDEDGTNREEDGETEAER